MMFHILTRKKIDNASKCEQDLSAYPLYGAELDAAYIGWEVQVENHYFLHMRHGELDLK